MNKVENNIVQLLTGKSDLRETTVEELQSIANQHPYFSVAQLLLTKRMKQVNHSGFTAQLQKTALHFPNQPWLYLQILSDEQKANDIQQAEASETFLLNRGSSENIPDVQPEQTEAITSPLLSENSSDTQLSPDDSEASIIQTQASTATGETIENNNIETQQQQATDDIAEPPSPVAEDTEDENITALLPAETIPLLAVQPDEVQEEAEPLIEGDNPSTENNGFESNPRLTGVLLQQAADFQKPVEENAKLPIEPEPFHTVDYFASQGIKAEAQVQDAMAKKVHKFTDWLRQMKRINPQPTDLGSDPKMESFVQTIAATSNIQNDIITEAMAEIFAKQGKEDKAIDIYEKLSLLNPVKSSYFAALIQQLKSSR